MPCLKSIQENKSFTLKKLDKTNLATHKSNFD